MAHGTVRERRCWHCSDWVWENHRGEFGDDTCVVVFVKGYHTGCGHSHVCVSHLSMPFISVLQYLLPAIVHISHQPKLVRGDGPMVSNKVNSLKSGPLEMWPPPVLRTLQSMPCSANSPLK